MSELIRRNIRGIDTFYIKSDKYKTITTALIFLHNDQKKYLNEYYFLSNILVDNMKKYPSNEKKYRYLSSLYGLEAFSSAKNVGNHIASQFVVTYPNEVYIEGENELSVNAFKFLIEMISNPKMRKGNFTKKAFKDNLDEANQLFKLLKTIKDMYAYYNYSKLFYQDKQELQYDFPTIDTMDSVDLDSLLVAYKNILEKSKMQIFVTGNIDPDQFDKIIEDHLPDTLINNNFLITEKTFPYTTKYQPKIKKDYAEVSQSRVFMGYNTNIEFFSDMHSAMSVMNDIFGGFDQSLLFTKIREKDNLVYYIDSNYSPEDHMLTVGFSCDVEKEDEVIEKVKETLEELIQGKFSDDLFQQAKDACVNAIYSINDSQTTYLLQQIKTIQFFNTQYDVQKRVNSYKSVTREMVLEAAKTLRLDTVYLYTKKENN